MVYLEFGLIFIEIRSSTNSETTYKTITCTRFERESLCFKLWLILLQATLPSRHW